MENEKIGTFKGKGISEMNREELLEVIIWLGGQHEELARLREKHMELDLQREVTFINT